MPSEKIDKRKSFPYYLMILYLIIEFIRPQSYVPGMDVMRPGLIIFLLLSLYVITHVQKFSFSESQTKLFLLILMLMTVHGPIAANNYYAFIVWKSMVYMFFVYLLVVNLINSKFLFDEFMKIFILILGIVGVVGVVNGGKVPNSGFLGDENDFALLMNMAFAISFFMSLNKNGLNKYFYLFLCGIFLSGVVLSESRGGFVGFIPVALFCFYKVKSKAQAILSLLLVLVVFISFAPEKYWDEMSTITEENVESGTGAIRWYYWQCGWRMFLDNPVIGVGQGNFPWRIEEYEVPGGYLGRHHGSRPAHSIYFTLLPELGLVGTLMFFILLKHNFKTISEIRRQSKVKMNISDSDYYNNISLGLLCAFIAYLFSGIFLSVLYYPHFWFFLSLPLALKKAMHKSQLKKNE
mgnify:FL=1